MNFRSPCFHLSSTGVIGTRSHDSLCGTGVWTQGFKHARQALYQLNYNPNPDLLSYKRKATWFLTTILKATYRTDTFKTTNNFYTYFLRGSRSLENNLVASHEWINITLQTTEICQGHTVYVFKLEKEKKKLKNSQLTAEMTQWILRGNKPLFWPFVVWSGSRFLPPSSWPPASFTPK